MKRSEADFKITWDDVAHLAKGGMHIFSLKNGQSVSIVMDEDDLEDDEHEAADRLKESFGN